MCKLFLFLIIHCLSSWNVKNGGNSNVKELINCCISFKIKCVLRDIKCKYVERHKPFWHLCECKVRTFVKTWLLETNHRLKNEWLREILVLRLLCRKSRMMRLVSQDVVIVTFSIKMCKNWCWRTGVQNIFSFLLCTFCFWLNCNYCKCRMG